MTDRFVMFASTMFTLAACAATDGDGDADAGSVSDAEGDADTDVVEDDDTASSATDAANESSTGDDESDSGGPSPESCSSELAHDVMLRELTVFQVVAIPFVDDGLPVAPQDRGAPLVQGRDAIVRARIDVPADFASRELGARVDLTSGESFLATEMIQPGGAVEFLVDVPAAAMQADVGYAVSIVECTDAAPGLPSREARFPVGGAEPLAAEQTGALRIHLVPFEVGGFVPDTSPAVIEGYRNALLSVYPVTDVEITIGDVEPDDQEGVVDMGHLLVRLGIIQESARSGPDVYYYGMVTGAATRDEFCDECPTGTSEAGNGNRAAFALGAAFGDQKSEDTLIHEIGHTHGLLHAPCGDPDDVDLLFPNDEAAIGVEGYDFRSDTFVPADAKDMMAYCYPRWISPYNYAKLVDWVQLAQAWGSADAPVRPRDGAGRYTCN